MLKVLSSHLANIRQQGESTYPQECCGLLLGHFTGNQGILLEVYATDNVWTPEISDYLGDNDQNSPKILSRNNRFSIAPEILLKVHKEARDRQLTILGVYHSHTDAPAIPSEFDRAIAYPDYSYLILSVCQGQARELLGWKLDDYGQFQPIMLEESSLEEF